MRGVVARAGALTVEELPEPRPGPGQVLVAPVACGICGSDLHTLELQAALPDALGPMVMGHEFCAEVLELGADADRGIGPGTLVCSVPYVDGPAGPELVGLSPTFVGGFAERMVLQADRLLRVPDGLDPAAASVTEPLAVGIHAVAAARLAADDVPLVLGCGPVGLAVIAALRIGGHRPVVVSDYSAARRALAERAGADVVVDPASDDPFASWLPLTGAPVPPSPLQAPGTPPPRAVVFDCVGAPGMTASIIEAAPAHTRIVVAGVCAVPDSYVPVQALQKELSMQYVFAYRPEEYARALHLIATRAIDVRPWITGSCDLDGVADAFGALADPEQHCKIIVDPGAAPTRTAVTKADEVVASTSPADGAGDPAPIGSRP
ncbi:MAG: zinc-binding dehydrogenase [Actinomycetota bacterium]|nr:zinc-binding dehydrogenase [Actinomycetota bacterium]